MIFPLQGLLIQLTRRCPLKCDHCYVTASPREHQIIDVNLLCKAIKEYAIIDGCRKALCLTGGDPFIVPDILQTGVKLGASLNFFVHVNTSAFFATSISAATRALSKMVGLSQLEISIDHEHQRFVSIGQVENAIKAAYALNIPTQLAIQGNEIEAEGLQYLRNKYPSTTLYVQNHAPVGERNRQFENHPNLMPQKSSGGCDKVGSIFVDETGLVFPCTSAIAASMARQPDVREKFALGNLTKSNLPELVAKIYEFRLCAVKRCGPSYIRKFLQEDDVMFRSACHECIYLATSQVIEQADKGKVEAIAWALQGSFKNESKQC